MYGVYEGWLWDRSTTSSQKAPPILFFPHTKNWKGRDTAITDQLEVEQESDDESSSTIRPSVYR